MFIPVVLTVSVLAVIIYFGFIKESKPLTQSEIDTLNQAQAERDAVLAQIADLEALLASQPTSILQQQIADLKASIGE